MKKRKAYVLPIAIIVRFFLSVTALTVFAVVWRYAGTVNERKQQLAEQVYDDPDGGADSAESPSTELPSTGAPAEDGGGEP